MLSQVSEEKGFIHKICLLSKTRGGGGGSVGIRKGLM